MVTQSEDIDLLALLSNKYFKLRKINEQMWSCSYNLSITNSEMYMISLIYGRHPSISEIAQQLNISRQATHKGIKSLSSKGLVLVAPAENNNRDKCLKLTSTGEKCFLENKRMRKSIERDVVEKIGFENVEALKDILKSEWI
ncbi:MAG: MarR family winged helix-turn-helix transcriptional regulator [Mobilitalea sp.]